STSTTTSYSYRVSKTFFNDRFKIVVGGNYSTDADADENFSQNLINDISFEYMLNKSGSMYIKIFRHTGYESILEGEITQTGVGFVLKRKLNTLWELFGIRRED
ncbi:translocation/assembly module TamB domain-containing protein, partial [uncultured Duncaniella sp.]